MLILHHVQTEKKTFGFNVLLSFNINLKISSERKYVTGKRKVKIMLKFSSVANLACCVLQLLKNIKLGQTHFPHRKNK